MIDILTILIFVLFISLFVALLLILITKLLRIINKKETKLSKWSIAKHIFLSYVLCLSVLTLMANYADYPQQVGKGGLAIAVSIKPDVQEYYKMHGSLPSSNSDAGIAEPTSFRDTYYYVKSATISEGGVITILFSGKRSFHDLGGDTLILKPNLSDGDIMWNCKLGTLPNKFRNRYCYTE